MLRHIITIAMLLFSISAFSQNILTTEIQWDSPSFLVASTGMSEEATTTITTTAENIVWRDAAAVKYDMTIIETIGTWTNVSQNGSVRYQVKSGDHNGVVEFKRSGSGTTVQIIIVEGEEAHVFKLNISGFELM